MLIIDLKPVNVGNCVAQISKQRYFREINPGPTLRGSPELRVMVWVGSYLSKSVLLQKRRWS